MAGISEKHFNAILAKNEIARSIRDYERGDEIRFILNTIVDNLKIIEEWIGESNQPTVKEILTSERKDI